MTRRRHLSLVALIVASLALPGCSALRELNEIMAVAQERLEEQNQTTPEEARPQQMMVQAVQEVDIISMNHSIADALVGELRKNHPSFHRNKPILVTTFVTLSSLENSSELGMMIADQIASRFTQHGYAIVEARMRHELAIRQDKGEFILSREVENLSTEYKATAVIVGNYSQSRDTLYVTARLIQLKDKQVLASVNAKVPLGDNTRDLLIDTSCCELPVVAK